MLTGNNARQQRAEGRAVSIIWTAGPSAIRGRHQTDRLASYMVGVVYQSDGDNLSFPALLTIRSYGGVIEKAMLHM